MNKTEQRMLRRGRRLCLVVAGIQILILAVVLLMGFATRAATTDLAFEGTLLDNSCQLDTGSAAPLVELPGAGAVQFNTEPGRSAAQSFTLSLVNCTAGMVGKVARLTFSGTGEPDLPGYVAVNSTSNPGRLGIGIIDTDGATLLPLGSPHNAGNGDTLTGTTLNLTFKAFLQSTPTARAQKSVVPGEYDATVNFTVEYQ